MNIDTIISNSKLFSEEPITIKNFVIDMIMIDYDYNRIYNKSLNRDWFSACLFVT